MHDARPRGRQRPLTRAAGARPFEAPLDDWLGDISDDDWGENATGRAELRVTPTNGELSVPEGDSSRDPAPDRGAPARSVGTAAAHRAAIERRRTVAGLVVVVLLGAAAAIAVLLVRDGGQEATVTPVAGPATTTTTPASEEASQSSAPTTTTPSPSTTPTTPPVTTSAAFTLPEGTKLQRGGEGDPSVVRELQQALSSAGYDPGPADGTFGQRTEAAVVAFQDANGLSVDGRVGPETAAALNRALADD